MAQGSSKRKRPPAMSIEAREEQLVALAVDLAERQMEEGTASAQVITHYLKLGTARERLEREKLAEENKLLKARTEQIASNHRMEELYEAAIRAMSTYQGNGEDDDYEVLQ